MFSISLTVASAVSSCGTSALGLKKYQPVKNPVKESWIDKSQKGGQDVPYGVAIFVGAAFTFWQVGYLHPETLMTLATNGIGN